MGARQSKRSVDITTTPKKEGIPSEGAVVGDAATPGDGKLERIEESDAKPTTNGIAYRTDVTEDKDKDKDEATEKDKEKMRKKWSLRSISFSKKDKSKPTREETPKNGDVTKEEPLAEVTDASGHIHLLGINSSRN
ncbi:brain acid soluble protein 1 [Vespula maculifrons]|uniref:Brain acid soluble protein 1 n=1 Tax=Vespula maculifrons TaxID=7453 RepID=A0ABD2BIR3_VESMC